MSSAAGLASLDGASRELTPPLSAGRLDPFTTNLLAAARQRARVTVITRTKDRPLMLRRCMESVLGQSFPDFLHVIVNDGGNPQVIALMVAERAARYHGRVQVINNPRSVGMQNASNIGVAAATGDYLVIHDDDDSWQPEFLRECVDFLDLQGPDSSVQGVVTQTARVLEEINAQGGIDEHSREDYLTLRWVDLFSATADNPFAPIAFVYRRAVHEQVGLFDERFSVVGDWDFNLRFLSRFDIGLVDQRLANYHWRHQSGGSVYANTVTDALEVHHLKSTELRNHYLRADLQAGRVGLGHLMNTSKLVQGHSSLLWDIRNRSDQTIHEIVKVQNRLRAWEWIFTRNPKLKDAKPAALPDISVSRKPGRLAMRRRLERVRTCRDELAGLFSGQLGVQTCRVLSLDVFDTALLRGVRQPIDVFSLMANEVRRLLGIPDLPVAALRISAERTARARQRERAGHEEVTLAEIYDAFCELAEVEPGAHHDALMRLETDAERRLLYGNPPLLAACAAAARAGARVVFASDMYLPREFILGELHRCGYPVAQDATLFLSAERGASKHVGDLYDAMLKELGCAPGEIVHVGDNFHSDSQQAKARGLRTIHWHEAAAAADLTLFDQLPPGGAATAFTDGDFLSSLCLGSVRRRRALHPLAPTDTPRAVNGSNGHAATGGADGRNGHAATGGEDLWDRIGYEVGGPLYFTFLHWLLNHARKEGIDRLYFLARDGHYLHQAADLMAARCGLAVESVYMAASRRLLNLPQVTTLDQAAMKFLLTPNPNLSVRHFLDRLGIDPIPLTDKIRQAGFTSLDEVITTPGGIFRGEADHRGMKTLFISLENEILRQAAEEQSRLLAYFRQIGFTAGGKENIAVVDVGWQASSARSLQTLLNLAADADAAKRTRNGNGADAASGPLAAHRLRAFYFGTWHYARPAVEAGCRFNSFFFHLDKPHAHSHLVAESVELIELFFGAPQPTIIGLREGADGRLETVHGQCEVGEAGMLARLARMRERAVEFVRDVVALAPASGPGEAGLLDWSGTGFNYVEGVLERYLRRPTLDEARLLGALPARDSFGGASPTRPLARLPGRWDRLRRPGCLKDAYQHAFWKKGFLAQLTPKEIVRVQKG